MTQLKKNKRTTTKKKEKVKQSSGGSNTFFSISALTATGHENAAESRAEHGAGMGFFWPRPATREKTYWNRAGRESAGMRVSQRVNTEPITRFELFFMNIFQEDW